MRLSRFTFPKSSRLVSNRQFRIVYARRLSATDGLLMVYACENDCDQPRLGVSIGKNCGSAVVRNRLKRLLREVFRQNREDIPAGFDYVVSMSPRWVAGLDDRHSAKAAVRGLTFEQLRQSFLNLAGKLSRVGA
jgi:ribonuclease P protein component